MSERLTVSCKPRANKRVGVQRTSQGVIFFVREAATPLIEDIKSGQSTAGCKVVRGRVAETVVHFSEESIHALFQCYDRLLFEESMNKK